MYLVLLTWFNKATNIDWHSSFYQGSVTWSAVLVVFYTNLDILSIKSTLSNPGVFFVLFKSIRIQYLFWHPKMFSFFHSKTYHDINPVSLIINAEYYVIIKEKLRISWICMYMMQKSFYSSWNNLRKRGIRSIRM